MGTQNTNQKLLTWEGYTLIIQSSNAWNVGKWVEENAMKIISPNSKELMERAEMMISYLESVSRWEEEVMEHNEYIVSPPWVHQFLHELRKNGENVSSFQERLDAIKLLILFRNTKLALHFSEIRPDNGKYTPESIQNNIHQLHECILEVRVLESEYANTWTIPTLIQDRIKQLHELDPDIVGFQQRFDVIKPIMLRNLTREWLAMLEKTPTRVDFSLDKIQSYIDQMRTLEYDDTETANLIITDYQSRLERLIPIVRIALADEEVSLLENSFRVELPRTPYYTKDRANILIHEAKLVDADTRELQRRLDAITI
jgi:hypothetical protein